MHLHDILTAIPWGLLLAFSIGPGFFVLLETSITKGFRAAFVFDLGIVFGDIIFILIAYLSTNQLLEQLKDKGTAFAPNRDATEVTIPIKKQIDTVKKILDPSGYTKSKRREMKEMNKLDQDFLF